MRKSEVLADGRCGTPVTIVETSRPDRSRSAGPAMQDVSDRRDGWYCEEDATRQTGDVQGVSEHGVVWMIWETPHTGPSAVRDVCGPRRLYAWSLPPRCPDR